MKTFKSFITEEEKVKKGKEVSVGKNTVKINPDSEELKEVAPPGATAERMVKHIKKSYSKDGKLTDKERSIAYATAWKHANESAVPGQPAERLGAVTAIPQKERDAARERLLAKTKEIRNKKKIREELEIEEGMDMKTFKANRKKNERRAASADAEKRGHVGKEWHNTGRKYSPDEAKSRRANMSDDDRAARHRAAVDPDDDRDVNYYSADKTKNPKKQRKQAAMGEAMSFSQFVESRRSEREGKGSPESPISYPGRKVQKERGEKGGRHHYSGSVEYGGAAAERGRKKSDPHSQEQRLRKVRNHLEKPGKYSEMQRKKRGGDIGSRFD